MFGYFQVFSKDKRKYDLNRFLVAISICFMYLYNFIGPSYVFL